MSVIVSLSPAAAMATSASVDGECFMSGRLLIFFASDRSPLSEDATTT
jgi:hypothetical protein